MLELLLNTFVILFVVLDPIGLTPLFAALTHGGSRAYQRRMAIKGTLVAGVILVTFVFVGAPLLRWLGVGIPAFRLAGGALLFLLAIEMVFARHSGLRSTTSAERAEAEHKEDIAVFPLAIPLIAGPGALTTLLLMLTEGQGDPAVVAVVLLVLAVVLGITLLTLLSAARLTAVMGETGANVVSRVLGVILAALAVQFMLDGLRDGLALA